MATTKKNDGQNVVTKDDTSTTPTDEKAAASSTPAEQGVDKDGQPAQLDTNPATSNGPETTGQPDPSAVPDDEKVTLAKDEDADKNEYNSSEGGELPPEQVEGGPNPNIQQELDLPDWDVTVNYRGYFEIRQRDWVGPAQIVATSERLDSLVKAIKAAQKDAK